MPYFFLINTHLKVIFVLLTTDVKIVVPICENRWNWLRLLLIRFLSCLQNATVQTIKNCFVDNLKLAFSIFFYADFISHVAISPQIFDCWHQSCPGVAFHNLMNLSRHFVLENLKNPIRKLYIPHSSFGYSRVSWDPTKRRRRQPYPFCFSWSLASTSLPKIAWTLEIFCPVEKITFSAVWKSKLFFSVDCHI